MNDRDKPGHHHQGAKRIESLNHAILDAALDCIITMDATGMVREFNPAAERVFGYTRSEAVGKELASLIVPPALRERHRVGLAHYLATGEGPVLGRRIEIGAIRKNGSDILVELAITAFEVDGQPMFAAYLRDITQRVQGEEAIRRLAAIIESSDDAILSKDLNGVITSWNKGAENLFGYIAEEVIGQPVTVLFPPDRKGEEPAILNRIRQGERVAHYETVRRHKSGKLFDVSLTVSPLKNDAGEVVGVSKIARDISDRVQSERRRAAQYAAAAILAGSLSLTDAAPKILEIVASSGDWVYAGIWLRDTAGTRLECVGTWHEPSSSLETFAQHSHTISIEPGQGLPGRVWSSAKPLWIRDVTAEATFPRRDAAAAAKLRGAFAFPLSCEGTILGVLELFSNGPTDPDPDLLLMADAFGSQIGLFIRRRRIEKELQRQKEVAEAANAAKDRFLATLSHELRTPLTPVLMWAGESARNPEVPASLREGLEMVARNVELEARLIDDLLDLTRISHGKLRLDRRRTDAHQLLGHAIEIVNPEIDEAGLKLSLELHATEFQVDADPARLQQVFWNVLRNARKFTPKGGEISVASRNAKDGMLVFEIRDTGVGIEQDNIKRIFNAFEQLETRPEGLGLGLAISQAIVEKHGGRIFARSEGRDAGSTFTIELPLARA